MITAKIIENDRMLIDETNKKYELTEYEKDFDILAQKRKEAQDEINELSGNLTAKEYNENEDISP